MQISDKKLKTLLDNIPDARQKKIVADIISSKILYNVYCLSEDIFEDQEVPMLDENGNKLLYEKGKKKGEVKTEVKSVQTRVGCNNRLIAYIYTDGKVRLAASEGKAWLRAHRNRLDGYLGFQCWCGNDSRLCAQEKGVTGMERNAVTKDDLAQVYKNLEKNPAKYKEKNNKLVVDGFLIERIV